MTSWAISCQVPLSMGILQARILEWVAMPCSRGSIQPRDRTQLSHIAGRFFTIWATREAHPRILEWVAYPFSRISSQPRNRTRISCIAGRFFISWATREAVAAAATAAAVKSLQLCPTLCNSMGCSLPGFAIHGILQARTLEWVAISFSNAWKWKVKVKLLSRVWLLATPWAAAYQAPPSMGFSGQQYWSGVPLPFPLVFLDTAKCPQGGGSTSHG